MKDLFSLVQNRHEKKCIPITVGERLPSRCSKKLSKYKDLETGMARIV